MEEAKPRCVPKWKILLSVFAVLLFVLVGAGLWFWSVGERRWGEMKTQLVGILREELARPAERPVLRGEATEGNAWDDYEKAFAGVGSLQGKGLEALQMTVNRDPKADSAAVEKLLPVYAPFLKHLTSGAGRARAKYLYRSQQGEPLKTFYTYFPSQIMVLAICQARFLADHGKGREAAELLLDACQLSRDLGFSGPYECRWIPSGILDMALDEIRALVLSGALTNDDLLEIGRGLEVLDGSFRVIGPLEPLDVMELGFEFLEAEDLSGALRMNSRNNNYYGVHPWEGWKYGFSNRLMVANAIEEAMDYANAASQARNLPWREFSRIWDEMNKRMAESRNPVVREYVTRYAWVDVFARQVRARLRLLRVAVQFRATGEILDLEDPFGARLLHQGSGTHLTVWSLGKDGVDQGGSGQWKVDNGNNIVLDVER
jgi:hypothetical protein